MITLTETVRQSIAQHAEASYPNECVGLLIGRVDGKQKTVEAIHEAPNNWSTEVGLSEAEHEHSLADRFYLDPREYMRADRAARAQGLDIVGCYHSHPDHPAVPSAYDTAHAWPWYSYLIVRIEQGQPREAASYTLDPDRPLMHPEPLEVLSEV